MYLFGYGSLINIASAQKSFHRVLKQDEFIPVTIKGFKQVWNSIENIDFEDLKNVNGIFLNLKKDENAKAFGVLIKITPKELEILKLREKNYSCIEIVPENLIDFKTDEKIYTFMTTKNEKIAKIGDKNSFIPINYIEILKNGLKNYNLSFISNYELILKDFPFELKSGKYSFSDPIQNKIAREGISNNETN